MYIPTGFLNQTEVEKAVDKFIKTLGPEVVRVRYNIGEDWTGDPALYFRVVLADSVATSDRETSSIPLSGSRTPSSTNFSHLRNWGLFPHVNFRSNAENYQLQRSQMGLIRDGLP